ncbi:GATA transcription factor 18-like isoform X2 [Andrographis paniculata]|nr:GATA transcription factor 18-like isoform X2 [Andrographis paniculata]
MAGVCSCGAYHAQHGAGGGGPPFCMVFSVSNGGRDYEEDDVVCAFNTTSSASSSVDCTLSLGTPSTRRADRRASCVSDYFSWNILRHAPPSKSHRASGDGDGDRLLARRCANCDTTSTPLWRNGPKGPKSLCNACGIRFKKEEKRAAAGAGEAQQMINWPNPPPPARHEFRFINDVVEDSGDGGMPFRSWRFNRPGLVHEFTR